MMGEAVPTAPGVIDSEALGLIRRATAQTLNILRSDRCRPSVIGRLAIHVAVEKNVMDLVIAGERNEARLCKSVLAVVLGARP